MNAPNAPLQRPIRVVLFSDTHLDPCALRFAVLLEQHSEIELVSVLCQAPAVGWRFRMRDRWKRRGLGALMVIARDLSSAAARYSRAPAEELAFRRLGRRIAPKILTVPNVHATEVLEHVRALAPDLGLIYGAPVLRQSLFAIPTLGTLGIHHGRVPEYRGKKTTFWEMYNGEKVAGVTIQRVDAGIDTGDIVKSGEVQIGAKSYGRVERESQQLGFELYLEAILAIRDGCATFVRQPPSAGRRHYRQPSAADFVKFWLRRARRRLGLQRT